MLSAGFTLLSVNGIPLIIFPPVVSCGSLSNTNALPHPPEITIAATVSSIIPVFFLRTYIFLGSFVNVVQHAVNTPRKSSREYGIHSKLYNIPTVEVNRNGFIFSNFIKSDRSETNFYKSSNKLLCRLCNIHK